ncbi:holin family protein [Marinobacter sp. BGYM27]|uniref:holin family protein n=1 Tax=Marinobacter sp. BGYM27 TaxID=2975597 RepID=UPI0021A7080D|nr:holin family protein [Marinobacter sp. BGYM27]MDG5498951.1 holin family protein [Marinobacter sp. BGYM27]
MSFLSNLFGGTAAQPIEAIGNVFDKLFTSDEEKAQAAAVLEKIAQQPHILQAEINKIEAQHRSIFVAGWRPWIGWVCGFALAYSFIVRDLVAWGMNIWAPDVMPPPDLAIGNLESILMALLGLGGLRTFEKVKGRSK